MQVMKQAIVFWGICWSHPTVGRTRYLAESIAELYGRDMQVIYVNLPTQWKFPLRHRDFWLKWKQVKQCPMEVHNGVNVLNIPPCPLPYSHHFMPFRILRAMYIGKRIWSYLDRTTSPPVLVTGDPREWILARWWRGQGGIVVYDCFDLMPAFLNAGERIASEEKRLIQFASLITCSSQNLVNHVKSIAPHKPISLIRNGVHWERFQNVSKIPPQLDIISRPRIGFVGSISYWVNVELIVEAAKQCPKWHFVLIGPVRTFITHLPNVHLLSPVRPEEVHYYIHGFDIGIIPFYDMPLTRCVNPLKLYEYLACGKPVVATPYGDFGDVEQWVYFAHNSKEFVDAINKALKEDCPKLQDQRREAARLSSWKERARQFFTVIQAIVNNSGFK